MHILRTPDERFQNLPEFPFAPHYFPVRDENGTDIRIHFVDEDPRDAAPIFLWPMLEQGMQAKRSPEEIAAYRAAPALSPTSTSPPEERRSLRPLPGMAPC